MSESPPLQFEMFATARTAPEVLWEVVGEPLRLPEWTDADEVVQPPPRPIEVGGRFVTRDGDRELEWVVITAAPRLLEVKTDACPAGRLGLGVHVQPDSLGARLIVAGMLDPRGRRLRARTVDLPALRRRCERWSDQALRIAGRR